MKTSMPLIFLIFLLDKPCEVNKEYCHDFICLSSSYLAKQKNSSRQIHHFVYDVGNQQQYIKGLIPAQAVIQEFRRVRFNGLLSRI
jgi:hypothetical protein